MLVADEHRALKTVAQMKQGRVVEMDEEIALQAAVLSIHNKLPMADSLIYATAKTRNGIVWTQDKDFKDLSGVKYIPAV